MFTTRFARFLAGIWFALAALIPVLFFIFGMSMSPAYWANSGLIMYGVMPVIIAGLCGTLLGHTILDERKVDSPLMAAARGLMVSLVSYGIFSLALALLPSHWGDESIWLVLLMGLVYVGWLVAIAGAVAGWLLYYVVRYSRGPTSKKPVV